MADKNPLFDFAAAQSAGFESPPKMDPLASLANIGNAASTGFSQAFGNRPVGLPHAAKSALSDFGITPDENGSGSLVQHLNAGLLEGVAQPIDLAIRGLGGLYGAYQAGAAQFGTEVGSPQLGRDLASLPDAFAGMPNSLASVGSRPTQAPISLAARNPRMYNLPTKAEVGVDGAGGRNVAAGVALHDAEGRPLNAPFIAGRRSASSTIQTALSPAEVDAVSAQGLGALPMGVAARELRGNAGLFRRRIDPETGQPRFQVLVDKGLNGRSTDQVLPRHRLALHEEVLDEILEERVANSRGRQVPRGFKRKVSGYPLRPRTPEPTTRIDVSAAIRIAK